MRLTRIWLCRRLFCLFEIICMLTILLISINYFFTKDNIDRYSSEYVISLWRTILLSESDCLSMDPLFDDIRKIESLKKLGFNIGTCRQSISLRNLAERLRIYRDLKIKYFSNESCRHILINEFEEIFFPWIRKSDSELNGFEKGTQGIVICLNDKYVQIGISSIMALERVGNRFPIEIVFLDDKELSENNRRILQNLPFVSNLINLSDVFVNISAYLPIGEKNMLGTYVKPFAALASSFEHVLLMDADVYFLQNPTNLFHSNEYLNSNFLLFTDRTIWEDQTRTEYYKSIMPQPYSIEFNQSRLIQGISGHEIESGVVVINKASQKSYLALLSTCLINTRCYRREISKRTKWPGEKETYWLALEFLQVPYYKNEYIGAIGDVSNNGNTICGHILHGDEFQMPLWWNGGFRQQKHKHNSPWINFKFYMWQSKYNSTLWSKSCLNRTSQVIYELTNQQLEMIHSYKKHNCSTFFC